MDQVDRKRVVSRVVVSPEVKALRREKIAAAAARKAIDKLNACLSPELMPSVVDPNTSA